MASLFDSLQKRLAEPAAQPLGGPQQQAQKVLAAKGGKAGRGATGPKASSVGQQVAQGAVQSGLQQGNLTGQLAGAQIQQQASGQQQQFNQQQQKLDAQQRTVESGLAAQGNIASQQLAAGEELAGMKRAGNEDAIRSQLNHTSDQTLRQLISERNITYDNLFSEFERSNLELEFRSDAADLEQRAFLLAMGDKAYTDELGRIGSERMLTNNINFKREMTATMLGENLSNLIDTLGWQEKMDTIGRERTTELANINITAALEIAMAALKDENRRMVAEGIGNAVTAGADAWSKNPDWYKSTSPNVRPEHNNATNIIPGSQEA